MKPQHTILAALLSAGICALAAQNTGALPDAWIITGESPQSYAGGIDFDHSASGKGAKFLRNVDGKSDSWATLMQTISAHRYLGQRVRFQARVRAADVSNWAGLWMAVDTPQDRSARFYNSEDKPIKGSSDWAVRSVVLDVPANASAIRFGVIDAGSGQVWIDDLRFEVVGTDVPADSQPRASLAEAPSL